MEAVFGARMAVRQNQVRAHDRPRAGRPAAPVGPAHARSGDHVAGARRRRSSPSSRRRCRPEGTRSEPSSGPRWRDCDRAPCPGGPSPPWRAGVAIGATVTLTVLTRHAKPAPIVVRGAPATVSSAAPAPATRRVLLPLPFVGDSRDVRRRCPRSRPADRRRRVRRARQQRLPTPRHHRGAGRHAGRGLRRRRGRHRAPRGRRLHLRRDRPRPRTTEQPPGTEATLSSRGRRSRRLHQASLGARDERRRRPVAAERR